MRRFACLHRHGLGDEVFVKIGVAVVVGPAVHLRQCPWPVAMHVLDGCGPLKRVRLPRIFHSPARKML